MVINGVLNTLPERSLVMNLGASKQKSQPIVTQPGDYAKYGDETGLIRWEKFAKLARGIFGGIKSPACTDINAKPNNKFFMTHCFTDFTLTSTNLIMIVGATDRRGLNPA